MEYVIAGLENDINDILANIISGGAETIDHAVLVRIENSGQDFSTINSQLEQIID